MTTQTLKGALQSTPSSSRRRWLRFSLRSFLIAVTILCIWLGMKVNRARQQKEAVEALQGLGIYVNYAHWRQDGNFESFDSRKELNVPAWLRDLAGDDSFRQVVAIRVLPPSSDEDLVHLSVLPHVDCLYLSGSGNNITDAGLAHLPQPDRLVHFRAGGTFVGDEFVKRLAGATRLETLELNGTRVTDKGLRSLRKLSNLKQLGLGHTQVGDAGLEVLRGMTALEILSLEGTRATDASLAHLKQTTNLQFVMLDGTRVTDAGLVHLHGLPKLISVRTKDTQVTDEGRAALQAATPSLRAVDEDRARRLKAVEEFRKRRGP